MGRVGQAICAAPDARVSRGPDADIDKAGSLSRLHVYAHLCIRGHDLRSARPPFHRTPSQIGPTEYAGSKALPRNRAIPPRRSRPHRPRSSSAPAQLERDRADH
jgi:hypothetical protein